MNFVSGDWNDTIDVRDFIQKNYTPYDGDGAFLTGPTERTKKLWEELSVLLEKERKSPGRVLDADTKVISGITSHPAGYINKDLEVIVGLQTEKPLKRAIMPFGGLRMVEQALEEHGYHLDPEVKKIFKYRRTHNESVFGVYTDDIRAARSSKLLTGLPDAYGRGRIIGDYRRVALYGVDYLLAKKLRAKIKFDRMTMTDFIVRKREEINMQMEALEQLKELGAIYG
ncbi:MAG: formate acetyltransferase, partial [Spirochaetia bacterium]|nr:formate acetyltransferase [Spirochaetia bacterium]